MSSWSKCDSCTDRGACFERCAEICPPLSSLEVLSQDAASENEIVQYVYTPLSQPSAIRLLRIFPSPKGGSLKCTVHEVALEDKPVYVALSYTWGDQALSHRLLCHGQYISITANLWSALQSAHFTDEPELIWADGVCINQEDLLERSQQVRLMGRIYSSAEHVLVCLGDGYGDEHLALNLIANVKEIVERAHNRGVMSLSTDTADPRLYNLPPWGDIHWQAVQRLMCHPWFTRTWIIQEYAIPSEIVATCGKFLFPPEMLPNFDNHLRALGLSRNFYNPFLDSISQLQLTQSVTFLSFLGSVRGTRQARVELSLEKLLSRQTVHGASDPRDHIYGYLGLIADSEAIEILPDYTLSPETTYLHTCRVLCHQGKLKFLYEAGNYRKNLDLPSWVPDWSVLRLAATLGRADVTSKKPDYAASDTMPSVASVNIDAGILEIHGSYVDTVTTVGIAPWKSKVDGTTRNSTQQQLRFWPWLQESLDLTARALRSSNKDSEISDPEIAKIHMRTLLLDNLYDVHQNQLDEATGRMMDMSDYHAAMQAYVEKPNVGPDFQNGNEDGYLHDVSAAILGKANWFINGAIRLSSWRRFCITHGGRVGQVPDFASEGDEIWILPGLRVPFVLRKVADGVYRLVGEAYVHGIMYGEALDNPGLDVRSIQLV